MAAEPVEIFPGKVPEAISVPAALTCAAASIHVNDMLPVTRLNRLARSKCDPLNIQDDVDKRGAGADSTKRHGRLMFTVPGVLAEFRTELILRRTNEGRHRQWNAISDWAAARS